MIAVIILSSASLIAILSPSDENRLANAYPKEEKGYHYDFGMMKDMWKPGHYASGTIASTQNDENGIPTWLVSGHWNGYVTSAAAIDANASQSAEFNAIFDMVMKNGSAQHQHKIYNFTLVDDTFDSMNMPWSENSTVTIDGTATVTMKDGPVHDVPVTQMMQGDVIGISVDPNMTNEHFGDTPIYGIAERLVNIVK
ncbi:MAG: hypothetical protein WA941_01830 [Nitrososphaeraceae archaeon]